MFLIIIDILSVLQPPSKIYKLNSLIKKDFYLRDYPILWFICSDLILLETVLQGSPVYNSVHSLNPYMKLLLLLFNLFFFSSSNQQ